MNLQGCLQISMQILRLMQAENLSQFQVPAVYESRNLQIFEVADIKLQDDLDLDIPKLEGEKPIEVICQPAPEMDKIMQEVSDNWDQAAKDRRLFIYYWMMKRSAIDVRLVDPSYGDWEHSKINKTVKM